MMMPCSLKEGGHLKSQLAERIIPTEPGPTCLLTASPEYAQPPLRLTRSPQAAHVIPPVQGLGWFCACTTDTALCYMDGEVAAFS